LFRASNILDVRISQLWVSD